MGRAGLFWVAVASVTLVIGGCSRTQPEERPAAVGTGGAGADLKNDGDFVHDVAILNMAASEVSRMALERATGSDVKLFAQRIVDDHDAAGNKLKSIATGQPIDWPASLDEKHRKAVDELAKKQGADFDREYVKAVIEGQQDLAAKLESRLDVQSVAEWKTAAAGRTQGKSLPEPKSEMRDVQVRPIKSDNEVTRKINQWAADTFPIAQKHLDTARNISR